MIGLELVPGIARETAHRLRRHPNVEVCAGDAAETVPGEATVLYLYNPFDARVMRRFAEVLPARADRPQATRRSITRSGLQRAQPASLSITAVLRQVRPLASLDEGICAPAQRRKPVVGTAEGAGNRLLPSGSARS
jgi:hypothetical protein